MTIFFYGFITGIIFLPLLVYTLLTFSRYLRCFAAGAALGIGVRTLYKEFSVRQFEDSCDAVLKAFNVPYIVYCPLGWLDAQEDSEKE